ncbi:MAG: alpha/beta fold hydrolase [Actinomycetota bacterium]|nr:alpha/beta fold hydrolase [Actinomycetota bacterium]
MSAPDAALLATLPAEGLPGLDPAWSRLVDATDADGVRRTWHVLDNGAAPEHGTLLCLHGNPTWSYLWRHVLAAAPPGWRVVAPDQLGMGYSERPDRPRRLADRIADLAGLTDALGIDGPVVVVAHDWGGPISLGWALERRQQVRGLVLSNTALHQPEAEPIPKLIALARSRPMREAVCVRTPTFVRAATALARPPLPREVRDAFAAPYSSAQRRRAVGDFVADIPLDPAYPSTPVLTAIAERLDELRDVPTLLLWGMRDPVFDARYLDDMAGRLPHADLHRFDRASHLVTEEAPETAGAVAAWVAQLDAPPADPVAAEAPERPPLWAALAARAGDRAPAIVVPGRAVSFDLLERRVRELAVGLADSGVRRGDRVALLVPPGADLTAAVYAVWRAGGVIVVADKGLGVRGMGKALRSARPDVVLGTAQGLAAARAMRLPGTRIAAGPMTPATMRALGGESSLADLARRGRAAPEPAPPSPEDECAVVFTSGATGPAKGVVYRHRQVQAQVELIRSTYALGPDDRLVAAFAPFAIYGPALGIGSAVPDMDVTSPGSLSARALADAVRDIDATVVFASPASLRSVLASADALDAEQRAALARVRLLMSAGAPVPAALLRSLAAVLPNAEPHTPYGMTEVLPVTDVSLAEVEAAGEGNGVCVGRPLPGVTVTVSPLSADGSADGRLTDEPDVTGEICVRAPHVKDRYDGLWLTERASSRNPGWHRTGDVGHLDTDGRLWVEGRLVHVVVTPDGVVTPVGIERRVEALDTVRSAAVVGVGPRGTQQVVVVVVPTEGSARPPLAELEQAAAVRDVADVDVAAVLVAPELPVDIRHNSKVDRQALARWASRVLAGGRV